MKKDISYSTFQNGIVVLQVWQAGEMLLYREFRTMAEAEFWSSCYF